MIASSATPTLTQPEAPPVAAALPVAAPKPARSAKRLDSLTSLRFFASACILIAHIQGNLGTRQVFAYPFALEQGVTFFFVLSGFILTYAYPHLNRSSAKRFIVSRFARIWPTHIVALLLYLAIVPATARWTVGEKPFSAALAVLLLHAWVPIPAVYAPFNLVSWSISTEMFFYLCFPLLLWRWRKTWHVKLLIAFALACGMIAIANLHLAHPGFPLVPQSADLSGLLYVNPLARVLEFTLGIATAHLWRRIPERFALTTWFATLLEGGLIALAGFVMYSSVAWSAWIGQFPLIGKGGGYWMRGSGFNCLVFAALILVFALQSGLLSRVLAFAPLVLLGEISYSTYLIHWPLLTFYKIHTDLFMGVPDHLLVPLFLVVVALASYVSYSIIELPCRRLIVAWWDRYVEKKPRRPAGEQGQSRATLRTMFRSTGWLRGLVALNVLLAGMYGLTLVAAAAPPSLVGLTKQPQVARADINLVGKATVGLDTPAVTIARHDYPNGAAVIGGWAFDQGTMHLAKGVFVTVDGTTSYWSQYGVDRGDVARYFNSPQLVRCGFRLALPLKDLSDGAHILTVRVANEDGVSYGESRQIPLQVG